MKKITSVYSIPEFKPSTPQKAEYRQTVAIKCISERQKFSALLHLTKKGYISQGKLKKAPCFIFCRLDMSYLYFKKRFTNEKVIATLVVDSDFKYII